MMAQTELNSIHRESSLDEQLKWDILKVKSLLLNLQPPESQIGKVGIYRTNRLRIDFDACQGWKI